jgi:diguanylate cyclase (GGDEF)-like protein
LSEQLIAWCRTIAEALRQGRFNIETPKTVTGEEDELDEALRDLADAIRERTERAATLAKLTQRINEGLVLEDVLDQVYDSFFSLIPYDRIGLALLEDDRKIVRARWARSEASRVRLGRGYAAALAGSSLEEVIRTGHPRILNDLEAYLGAHPGSDSTRLIVEEGMRSSLTCPLIVKGEPVGLIFFSSTRPDTYDESHQDLFMQIADQLATIVEKSRLYDELLRLNERLQETMDALERLATRDSLTGLWNRRSILELLQRELARSRREERTLSAVMVDIDHFKSVNDEIGHLAGDEVLREVTRRVGATLRAADVLGRLGGEEFLIILSPADERTAREVMERARLACAASPVALDGHSFEITVSLGAAVVSPEETAEMPTVLTAADRALYRAKHGGRNRSEIETLP